MKNRSYYKTVVKNGVYYRVKVQETIEVELDITAPTTNATITHTGAYAQIKFITEEGEEFSCSCPAHDKDIVAEKYGSDGKIEKVISIINVTFNLSQEEIKGLHSKYYINYPHPDKPYWVELP